MLIISGEMLNYGYKQCNSNSYMCVQSISYENVPK